MKKIFFFLLPFFFAFSQLFSAISQEANRALQLINQGKYRDAKLILEQEIIHDNENKVLLFSLFKIYIIGEEWTKAEKTYKGMPERLKKDEAVLLELSHLYFRQGHYQDALFQLQNAKKNKFNHQLHLRIYEAMNDWESFENYLNNATDISEKFKDHHQSRLANKLSSLFQSNVDNEAFEEALNYGERIAQFQNNPTLFLEMATIYFNQNHLDQATYWIERAKESKLTGNNLKHKANKLEGLIFIQKKEFQKAIPKLKQAKKLKSVDFDIVYYLGLSHFKLKHFSQATEYFQSSLSIKKNKEAYYYLSQINIFKKEYDKALIFIREYLHLAPNDTKTRNILKQLQAYKYFGDGNKSYEKKKYAEATKAFRLAVLTHPPPAKPVFEIMLAKSLFLTGHKKKDKAYIKQAETLALKHINVKELLLDIYDLLNQIYFYQKDFDKSKKILEQRKKLIGEADHELLFDTAYQYELQNNFSQALSYYKKAFEKRKSQKNKDKVLHMLKNMTTIRLNEKNIEQAVIYLNEAKVLNPNNLDIARLTLRLESLKNRDLLKRLYGKANLTYSYGQYTTALQSYQQVYQLDPQFADVSLKLGDTHWSLEQYRQAALYYSEFEKNRNSLIAATGHVYALFKDKQYHEAIKEAGLYFGKYGKKNIHPLVKLQHWAYLELGQLDDALKIVWKYKQNDPENAYYPILLGNHYYNSNDYFKALELYQDALELRPLFYVLHFNLGLLNLKMGKSQDAIRFLKDSLRLQEKYNPNMNKDAIYFYLAKAHDANGNQEQAKTFILKVFDQVKDPFSLDPDWLWSYVNILSESKAHRLRVIEFLDHLKQSKDDPSLAYAATHMKVAMVNGAKESLEIDLKSAHHRVMVEPEIILYQDKKKMLYAIRPMDQAILWTRTELALLSTTPIYQNKIYIGLENEFVKELDPKTGKELKKHRLYATKLAVDGSNLFGLSESLTALIGDRQKYSVPIKFRKNADLHLFGDLVIVHAPTGVQIFDKQSGKLIREKAIPHGVKTACQGNFIAMQLIKDEKYQWMVLKSVTLNEIFRTPSISEKEKAFFNENYLFTASLALGISQYDLKTSRKNWSRKINRPVKELTLNRDRIFILHDNHILSSYSAKNGQLLWSKELETDNDTNKVVTLLANRRNF